MRMMIQEASSTTRHILFYMTEDFRVPLSIHKTNESSVYLSKTSLTLHCKVDKKVTLEDERI